jgi:hypothetical protein
MNIRMSNQSHSLQIREADRSFLQTSAWQPLSRQLARPLKHRGQSIRAPLHEWRFNCDQKDESAGPRSVHSSATAGNFSAASSSVTIHGYIPQWHVTEACKTQLSCSYNRTQAILDRARGMLTNLLDQKNVCICLKDSECDRAKNCPANQTITIVMAVRDVANSLRIPFLSPSVHASRRS